MLPLSLGVWLAAAAGSPPAACAIDLLDAGAGSLGPARGALLLDRMAIGHEGKASSPHAVTEVYFAPGCEGVGRRAALLLLNDASKAQPLSWKSAQPVVVAVGPVPQADRDLSDAVRKKDLALVKDALARGANPTQVYLPNPLSEAIMSRQEELALLLLGGHADGPAGRPSSALNQAVYMGMEQVARRLLEGGADPNQFDAGDTTAAVTAVDRHSLPLVKLVVEHGADVNLYNSTYGSPLCEAVDTRYAEATSPAIVAYLLGHGAKPDGGCQGGGTAFERAVKNTRFLDQLLAAGANPNRRGAGGNTPLWVATSSSLPALLAHGVDLTVINDQGQNPLHGDFDVEVAAALVAQHVSIDLADHDGFTPLHAAAARGDSDGAAFLIQAGAKVNPVSTRPVVAEPCSDDGCLEFPAGSTPLDVAVAAEATDVIALLRSHGAIEGRKPTPSPH